MPADGFDDATRRARALPGILLAVVLAVLAWSGVEPHDRTTWWLEVFPVLLVVPVLLATGRRYPLTPLLYVLVAIHAVILMVGGHYTYARVPIGFWVQDLLDWSRNHYDRLGHLAQGFVPAIAAREVLLRSSPLRPQAAGARPSGWVAFLVTAVALAVSALYELIEWWAALAGGEAAESFLGTQGDVWDTQWDMFLAMLGAIAAQLLLARLHDRQLARLHGRR